MPNLPIELSVSMSRTLVEKFMYMDALKELAFWHRAKMVRTSGCYHNWSYAGVGRQLGVSPSTAKRRIKFLKKHKMVSFYGNNLYFNSLESVTLEYQLAYIPVSIQTGTSLKEITDTFRRELLTLEQKRQYHAIHKKDRWNISQTREPKTVAEAKAKARASRHPLKNYGCPEVEGMLYGSRDTLAAKMGMSVPAFDKFIRRMVHEGKITKRHNFQAIMPYFDVETLYSFMQSKGFSKKYFTRFGTIYEQLANNYILHYHDNRFEDMKLFFEENNIKVNSIQRKDFRKKEISVLDYPIYESRFDTPKMGLTV
jgi:DNA-binding Lrp family transcriptional regulator